MQYNDIEYFAKSIRYDCLKMLYHCGYGHVGGSFSIIELLAVIYANHLRYDIKNPKWEDRDYFVLSKGHSGPALYSTLANVGFFDKKILQTLNQGGTHLPSHADRNLTIGVDVTTGSLGQGTSKAAGIAMGLKKLKKDNFVYLVVGDGELNEGQCWEAFQFIANYKLNNLIVIIDNNKRQLDGFTDDIIKQFDIKKKMEAFGFYTKVAKGNDIKAIDRTLIDLKSGDHDAVCMILDSIKGQGIKFFEELNDNHSVKFNNDKIIEQTLIALKNLEDELKGGNYHD